MNASNHEIVHTDEIHISTPNGTMPFTAGPEWQPPTAVILVDEALSLDEHIGETASALAGHGYAVVAPDFGRRVAGGTVRYHVDGSPAGWEVLQCPGVDHGFHCHRRTTYHSVAVADAWRRCLCWFDVHLPQ